MKNKQAKRLMMNTCVRVSDNGEVSWMNAISITGSNLLEGSVVIHSEYLGALEESAHAIAQKSYQMNFPLKECREVF